MLNLLSIEKKRKILGLYRSRIAIVVTWFGFVAFLIAIASLLPLYIIVQAEYKTRTQELNQLKSQEEFQIEEELQNDILEINKNLTAFSSEEDMILLSQDVLNALLNERSSNIHITELFYASSGETSPGITIVGVADTRADLQAFADRLEKSPAFTGVELPISNLIKNSNVDFRISAFLEIHTE